MVPPDHIVSSCRIYFSSSTEGHGGDLALLEGTSVARCSANDHAGGCAFSPLRDKIRAEEQRFVSPSDTSIFRIYGPSDGTVTLDGALVANCTAKGGHGGGCACFPYGLIFPGMETFPSS